MFKKLLHFIKYNNAAVLILAFIMLAGTGVFAATDAGQELIGQKNTRTEGIDNVLLLEADLDAFDMDHKIERIERDDQYYYVIYTYLDLKPVNNAWQYQLREETRKVSLGLRRDLGQYMAEQLFRQYEARLKDLKAAQAKAKEEGPLSREELTEFSGLIGQTLDLAGRVFPGYEPVKRRLVPSPETPPTVLLSAGTRSVLSQPDDLSAVYEDYIARLESGSEADASPVEATENPELTDSDPIDPDPADPAAGELFGDDPEPEPEPEPEPGSDSEPEQSAVPADGAADDEPEASGDDDADQSAAAAQSDPEPVSVIIVDQHGETAPKDAGE